MSMQLELGAARYLDRDSLRSRVLEHLRGRGSHGATDDEIQAALDIDGNTERPRRRELEGMGLVQVTEGRRLTRSGRTARVYRAI